MRRLESLASVVETHGARPLQLPIGRPVEFGRCVFRDVFDLMVPKRLKAMFEIKGYVTVREFCTAAGMSYNHALRRVQAGEIPAVNLAESGERSIWRLYEEPITEWFLRKHNRIPAPMPEESIPDYYDDQGEWIPPEDR